MITLHPATVGIATTVVRNSDAGFTDDFFFIIWQRSVLIVILIVIQFHNSLDN